MKKCRIPGQYIFIFIYFPFKPLNLPVQELYMDTSAMVMFAVVILGGIAGLYTYFYFKDKKSSGKFKVPTDTQASTALRLQAYERLVLLVDRIALPNLVSRINVQSSTAREMQSLFIQTIKQEYDHNITQQIYVSPEAWEAVRNLKEQNMLIINQVSAFLPENASGPELSKSLMELLMENPKASLHMIVSEALNYEAKKLM